MSKGYIFVSPGSDPGAGFPLADPLFRRSGVTTMGQCRPDLRKRVRQGDAIFVLSGRIKAAGVSQYLIGGLSVDQKIDALLARDRFPENTLKIIEGEKIGNVIVTAAGEQDPLDHHPAHNFKERIKNYIVAKDAIYLDGEKAVELGRERTLDILRRVFDKPRAKTVHELIHRNRVLDEKQIQMLLNALQAIKTDAK
jgi:hypothetical protein